jgi:hypothetical protein
MTSTLTLRRLLALVLTLATLLLAAMPSHAIPAFARQTGKACSSCHFQHFPELNEFGMDFKASGYTDIKNKPVSGTELSLADTLYAAVYTTLKYQKTSGKDGTDGDGGLAPKSTHSGEWQFPDEFSLLLGGRIGKNIGFVIEAGLANNPGPVLSGFKIPMMWELGDTGMKVGAVPFSTDNLGASYGFEMLSTGAVKNIHASEHEEETSAQQYVFFSPEENGAAAGISLVLYDPKFYVTLTPYTPTHRPGEGNGNPSLGNLNATYFRAAYTPKVGDWALGAGVQAWAGSNVRARDGNGTLRLFSTKGWAVDAQAQGAVAGLPLGVFFSHASAPATDPNSTAAPNLFNPNARARTATSISAELGILPAKATLLVGYRKADDGSDTASSDNAFTLGATYNIYQNVRFELVHSVRQRGAGGAGRYGPNDPANGTLGGKSQTTLVFAAAY